MDASLKVKAPSVGLKVKGGVHVDVDVDVKAPSVDVDAKVDVLPACLFADSTSVTVAVVGAGSATWTRADTTYRCRS